MSGLQEHWQKLQEIDQKEETLGIISFIEGGEGSGNFDHAGRPGLVGGSAPSSLRGRRGVGGKIKVKPPTPSSLEVLHRATSGFLEGDKFGKGPHWDSYATLVAANRVAGREDTRNLDPKMVEQAIQRTELPVFPRDMTPEELQAKYGDAGKPAWASGKTLEYQEDTPENRAAAWEKAVNAKVDNIRETQNLAAYKFDKRYPQGGMSWRGVRPEEGQAIVAQFNADQAQGNPTYFSTRPLIASSIRPEVAYGSQHVLQFHDLSGDRVLGAKWMREFTPAYSSYAKEAETTLFGSTKWRVTGISQGTSDEAKSVVKNPYWGSSNKTTIHVRPYYGPESDKYYKDVTDV